jgi:hypothetical protein
LSRIANDHYPTPEWMTQCLIDYAKVEGTIFEPCAGADQAIAKMFVKNGHPVQTNDLYFDNCHYQFDATNDNLFGASVHYYRPNWIITNPPYNCAQAIIENSHKYAKVGVAMLLRVTADEMVMGNPSRYNWWAEHPESLAIKMPRFSFAKSSKSGRQTTDSTYCQWFVWRKDGHQYPNQVIRLPHDQIPGFSRKPIKTSGLLLF